MGYKNSDPLADVAMDHHHYGNPQEHEEVSVYCYECNNEIQDTLYEVDGLVLCAKCYRDYLFSMYADDSKKSMGEWRRLNYA